jgi:hypothetical protein
MSKETTRVMVAMSCSHAIANVMRGHTNPPMSSPSDSLNSQSDLPVSPLSHTRDQSDLPVSPLSYRSDRGGINSRGSLICRNYDSHVSLGTLSKLRHPPFEPQGFLGAIDTRRLSCGRAWWSRLGWMRLGVPSWHRNRPKPCQCRRWGTGRTR